MRIKSLLSTIFLCGVAAFAMAQEPAKVDTTEMGVHPYKDTQNMAWETTGFSLTLHGGVNVFNGDYPTERFTNLGYPSVGLNVEYNFSPMWGIGLGYTFSMPKVTTSKDKDTFRNIDGNKLDVDKGYVMHKAMMHKGQVYLTFDLINAWFPRAWKDIFGLNVFAGIGAAMYKNSVSFHDTGETDEKGNEIPSGKYVLDGDNAHAHKTYETVGFVPLGASAEFNVSRQIAIGARFQYNMFLNDYVDNRYMDKANKRNDGMYDAEIKRSIFAENGLMFFVPVVMAFCHVAACFGMMSDIMKLFMLTDIAFMRLCVVLFCLFILLVYVLMYYGAYRVYINIVLQKETAPHHISRHADPKKAQLAKLTKLRK